MKVLFSAGLFFLAIGLFASAPLEGGFSAAPRPTASTDERSQAYIEARNRVISEAVKYENTPYRYGGMSAAGLDCSGFICLSFKDALGVNLPRTSAGLYTWAERIPLDKAQPGDLLFFKTDTSGSITHVALYLGNRRFIHSTSAGAKPGVIYNTFDEGSWARTFVSAGRVFPEAPASYQPVLTSASANRTGSGSTAAVHNAPPARPAGPTIGPSSESGRLLLGLAFAPTWNGFLKDGDFVRGFSSQIRLGADTHSFGKRMIFGLELRPEYDGALGVFRLPITFSWGTTDTIRIFAGPVFSFGDASLSTEDGERSYSGGTSWIGTIGITAAPFIFPTAGGEFAPYMELAWQSYYSSNSNFDFNADFSAGFRFSTGIRWTIPIE